ncbi:MAG TPA: hypothetical protein VJ032_06855 [Thermoanaerobaculia bacterium]|nr:hypothetical protein [Thermoanaerobaculia bacterium]
MYTRQSVVALSFAATFALATFAGAAETKTDADARAAAQQVAAAAKAAAAAPITLNQIFAEVAGNLETVAGPHGFVITTVTTPDVVVVRREANGTRSAACVNSEKAAREFFTAPERKPAKAEKE